MQVLHEKLETPVSNSAFLDAYLLDNSTEMDPKRRRPAVVICPGGGYKVASDREAEPVAVQLLAAGFQAFVLRYSVMPVQYPAQFLEIAEAMKQIRTHAEAWHVDPDKIVVGGFSAGGHIAAALATLWNGELYRKNRYNAAQIKPNGLFLAYAVVTAGEFRHEPSLKRLLGERINDSKLTAALSLENRVSAATPPTFIWQTAGDQEVPIQNSLMFANSLAANKIPFELHVFPKGGHSLSLATAETARPDGSGVEADNAVWMPLFITWVKHNI